MKVGRDELHWQSDMGLLWNRQCPICDVEVSRWITTERFSRADGQHEYSHVIVDPCGHKIRMQPIYAVDAPTALALMPI